MPYFCFPLFVPQIVMKDKKNTDLFMVNADKFVCSVLPESPTKYVNYSPGIFRTPGSRFFLISADLVDK